MISEHKRACKKCGIEKPLYSFEKYFKNGREYFRWTCRDCKRKERLVYERQYRKKNYKKKSEINRKWAIKNKELLYANRKKKRESDEVYRCIELLRNRLWKVFDKKGEINSESLEKILGCTTKEFYSYLMQTYFENYKEKYNGTQKVNIDHVVPLATAKTKEDVYKLFHYKNLQLLSPEHNKRKWCKESWKIENSENQPDTENCLQSGKP